MLVLGAAFLIKRLRRSDCDLNSKCLKIHVPPEIELVRQQTKTLEQLISKLVLKIHHDETRTTKEPGQSEEKVAKNDEKTAEGREETLV